MKTKYLSLLLALLTCSVVFGQNNNAWQQQQQQQRMLEQQRMQQEQQRMQQEQQRRMQEQQRMEQQRRMEEMQRQRAQQMEAQRRQQQEAMRQQQEAARRQQQIQQQQVRDRQMADQRQRQTAQVQQRMQAARTNTVNQQRRNIAASIVKQKQPPTAPRQTATAPAAQGKSTAPVKAASQTKSAALKASVRASVDKAKIALTQKKTAEVKQETGRMRAEIKRNQGKTQMLRAKLQTLIKTQQAQAKAAAKAAVAKMKGLSALRAKAKEVPPAQAKPKPKGEICFVAGTLVKTINGLVPIEDIRVGNLVWSRDDQTGDEGWKPVVQLFMTYPTELVHLSYTIEGSSAVQTLTGTAIHPFWSEDRQQWVNMGHLDINETLSLDDAERNATVSRVEREIAPTGQAFTTFNFEVAGWHTYFVAPKNSPPSEASLWVHNKNEGFCETALLRIEKTIYTKGPSAGEKILARFSGKLPPDQIKRIQKAINAAKGIPDQERLANILKIDWGKRPDPATYLPRAYRLRHKQLFSQGVARIQPEKPKGKIGVTETWVMPKQTAIELIKKANGNVRSLEVLLGLDKGYLGNKPVLVDIPNPRGYSIPTGNEYAANEKWRPGGFTSRNIPEAIINPVDHDEYSFSEIEVSNVE